MGVREPTRPAMTRRAVAAAEEHEIDACSEELGGGALVSRALDGCPGGG
jgi:hypothetical protein